MDQRQINMLIRQATERDIEFLIDTIFAAEKSNTNTLSYAAIFEMSEEEVRLKFREMLAEDVPGQELCISGFLIAEVDGNPAGAICAWIEGENGHVSSINKASLLVWFLGKEKCDRAAQMFPFLSDMNFERKPGTLQFESAYVLDKYRGLGIIGNLFKEHIHLHKKRVPSLKRAQLVVAGPNDNAIKAYEKLGFKIVGRKHSDNPDIRRILPSDTKLHMELEIQD